MYMVECINKSNIKLTISTVLECIKARIIDTLIEQ